VHVIRLVTKSGVILDTCVSGGQLDNFLWKMLNSQFAEHSYCKVAKVSASAFSIPPQINTSATKYALVEVKAKLSFLQFFMIL